MAELLDALGKPALPYLNGGSGEHSGEPYLTFPTYDLPQPNEVLPAVIVSLPQLLNPDGGSWTKTGNNDYIARRSDGSLLQITPDIYIFSQWASITRYLADLGINNAVENPYQSVQQDDGSPGLNEPQPASVYGNGTSGFMINWLGCRCSWPVTQMMWYQALGCQLHSWAAVVVAVLTLFLEIALLDGLLTGLVRQAPHKTRKYSIENTQNQARDDPIGYVWQNTEAIVLPLVILLLVIGTAFGNSPVGTQYIQSHALLRIQLRSLASRYEGQTYAYCTLVFWCVVTTVKGVIVPAYIVVAIPAIIVIGSSGTALQATLPRSFRYRPHTAPAPHSTAPEGRDMPRPTPPPLHPCPLSARLMAATPAAGRHHRLPHLPLHPRLFAVRLLHRLLRRLPRLLHAQHAPLRRAVRVRGGGARAGHTAEYDVRLPVVDARRLRPARRPHAVHPLDPPPLGRAHLRLLLRDLLAGEHARREALPRHVPRHVLVTDSVGRALRRRISAAPRRDLGCMPRRSRRGRQVGQQSNGSSLFSAARQAIPWCIDGPSVCPPHTGVPHRCGSTGR